MFRKLGMNSVIYVKNLTQNHGTINLEEISTYFQFITENFYDIIMDSIKVQ